MTIRMNHVLGILLLISCLSVQSQELNIAKPDKHPYVHPEGNRDLHEYSYEKVNEARVYDFYSRQADYYLQQDTVPSIIPSFPGLDAGMHGHWGKYNQNNHNDGQWNDIAMGHVFAQVYRNGNYTIEKGVCLDFPVFEDVHLGACFDPLSGTYLSMWEGGFIKINPYRWGTSRNASPDGKLWMQSRGTWNGPIKYDGYSRNGEKVVFRYSVSNHKILDFPCADSHDGSGIFTRTLEFPNGASELEVWIAPENVKVAFSSTGDAQAQITKKDKSQFLSIKKAAAGDIIIVALSPSVEAQDMSSKFANYKIKPSELLTPGKAIWQQTVSAPGKLGTLRDEAAYRVDTITTPLQNPYNTVMQLTGIDFTPNGDAYISVLCGEVWKVTGLNDSLDNVTWKRFATGLNQPIGIHIDEDGLFVLCRDQLSRLHDLNNDGEADYYESYTNDFGGYDRSHTHVFGLHRASDGSFSFVRREQLVRTSPDPERKTTEIAYGVRNCMGVGGAPDGPFLVAPQEGTWTPTSAILEVSKNAFFGLPGNRNNDARFSPASIVTPLCFVPRGVDNSTGGMVYIDSDKWGPFSGSFVGLSYGYGQHYLILRDTEGNMPQGAVVPLEGEFAAGVMRGAFHPKDGQLYTVGLDGWGDYSTQDGCFHRVVYTGRQVMKPTNFHAFSNGIRIDFPVTVDKSSTTVENFFVQQWNYEYSKQYGSPEYSVKTPGSLGHDQLEVKSVSLTNKGKSIFLEIPEISPVMQLHVRLHLKTTMGKDFSTDFFTTIHELSRTFSRIGLTRKSKLQKLALRIKWSGRQEAITETGEKVEGSRKLTLNATSGLKYVQTKFSVKAGEPLELHFINSDAMPHNVVFVKEGAVKKVGEASFKMLNDPEAANKHYVPNLPEVISNTHVINPGNKHILHFRAPEEKGKHHFVCTFPGHWMTMQGILEVE